MSTRELLGACEASARSCRRRLWNKSIIPVALTTEGTQRQIQRETRMQGKPYVLILATMGIRLSTA